MTANIVPITDNVPALRDESVNQPPRAPGGEQQLDGDRRRDDQDEDECSDPGVHGELL